MRLHFVDNDPDVAEALRKAFSSFPAISVKCDDILRVAENCVVSPANSSGFMDGGIDAAYVKFFGYELQSRLQNTIHARPEGSLPVGAGLLLKTGHTKIPYMLAVATMVGPEAVESLNVYRAMRAVLRTAAKYPAETAVLYCPGLGTGVGGVLPEIAAEEMRRAYFEARS